MSGLIVGNMDNDKVLCEVTENHLNTGLRGIPVGTCRTSFVTPTEGVHYCGYPIKDLVNFSPEEVIYLLMNKELPNAEETAVFTKNLQSRGKLPDEIIGILSNLPKNGHPMDWLSIGIHSLGMFDENEDWQEKPSI